MIHASPPSRISTDPDFEPPQRDAPEHRGGAVRARADHDDHPEGQGRPAHGREDHHAGQARGPGRQAAGDRQARRRSAGSPAVLAKRAGDAEKEAVNALRERAAGSSGDVPQSSEVERNRYGSAQGPEADQAHLRERAPQFSERPGGYTRIIKLGRHRIGDAAELCVLQFVGNEQGPEIGGKPSTRRRIADKDGLRGQLRKGDALRPSRGVRQSRRASPARRVGRRGRRRLCG